MSDNPRLLTQPGSNPKTAKGVERGWWTAILHLAPARTAGKEVCPHRTPGCTAACLFTAGRGRMNSTRAARIARTKRFLTEREMFMLDLVREINAHRASALRRGLVPAVRLNGTSDIRWEKISPNVGSPTNLMELFPDVQFYDYTKWPYDKRPDSSLPDNYALTFSRGETERSDNEALYNLCQGRNVAVVFDTKPGEPLPTRWQGWKVIDGDEHDIRVGEADMAVAMDADTPASVLLPVVVGLRAKGAARQDLTGFTIHTTPNQKG